MERRSFPVQSEARSSHADQLWEAEHQQHQQQRLQWPGRQQQEYHRPSEVFDTNVCTTSVYDDVRDPDQVTVEIPTKFVAACWETLQATTSREAGELGVDYLSDWDNLLSLWRQNVSNIAKDTLCVRKRTFKIYYQSSALIQTQEKHQLLE